MPDILAERTLTVELEGQPNMTIRVVVGYPTMVREGEYQTLLKFHGPSAGAVLERPIRGGDAWQSVRHAFWIGCGSFVTAGNHADSPLFDEAEAQLRDRIRHESVGVT